MHYQIRDCRQEDFPYLLPLFDQLWTDKTNNEDKLKEVFLISLETTSDKLIVTEMDKKPIAFCAIVLLNNFWQEGIVVYISTLVVDEKYRAQGIGHNIIKYIIEYAKSRGCGSIELDSAFFRPRAHHFYETHGFVKRAYTFSLEL
jgi:(aminoalkyl)phosphonate N-acetyltransferase